MNAWTNLAAGKSGDAEQAEEKPAGPTGGVQPGLHGDDDKVIEGPEPLMGVKHLDALEKGKLAAGNNGVSMSARMSHMPQCDLCCLHTCVVMSVQHYTPGTNLSHPKTMHGPHKSI